MILKPCKCGQTPILTETVRHGINILRVECKCGLQGGAVMYTKQADADRTKQATVDGWNLAD